MPYGKGLKVQSKVLTLANHFQRSRWPPEEAPETRLVWGPTLLGPRSNLTTLAQHVRCPPERLAARKPRRRASVLGHLHAHTTLFTRSSKLAKKYILVTYIIDLHECNRHNKV